VATLLESSHIAAGEVDTVAAAQLLPRKRRVVTAGAKLLADHSDRALASVVDERDPAALRLVRPGDVHPNPARFELLTRAPAELVVAEDGEKRRLAPEVRKLDGGDRASSGRLGPRLGGVHDLARLGHRLDADEVDPLDVADHGGAHASHSRVPGR
jgi:hypothetical protein